MKAGLYLVPLVGTRVNIVPTMCRFDGVRNFSVMRVHSNNLFHRDVRVFAAATVSVGDVEGVGDVDTSTAGLRYDYKRDSLSELARSVSVPLRHLVARTLTVRLDFDARWLMISEIQFVSGALFIIFVISLTHCSNISRYISPFKIPLTA